MNLAYADPSNQPLHLGNAAARASASDKEKKIKGLWSPAIKAWCRWSGRSEDRLLIRVDVEQAEYWHNPQQ